MSTQDLEDVLAHYGIKGMKWGVRRSEAQLERARNRKSKKKDKPARLSEDAAIAEAAKKQARDRGTKSLTNKQLEQVNQRMNLEHQFSSLTDKTSKISKGQKLVKETLSVSNTANEVIKFAQSPMGKELVEMLKKKKG